MPNQSRIVNVLTSVVFVCICLFTLGYSNYTRYFAEVHINLPFLDFPIFVGEMLLAVCLVYILIKWTAEKSWHEKWKIGVGLYLLWILIKAVSGYLTYGAFAFRNAALFYYPFFVVVGYEIFNKRFFDQKKLFMYGVLLLILIYIFKQFSYYSLSYFLICTCIFLMLKNVKLRWFLFAMLFIVFPVSNFFKGGRSYFVGTCVAFIFLWFYFIFIAIRNKKLQILISLVCVVLFLIGVKSFGNKNKIKSLVTPFKVWKTFQAKEAMMKEDLKVFKYKNLQPKLYNPESKDLFQHLKADPRDRFFDRLFLEQLNSLKTYLNPQSKDSTESNVEGSSQPIDQELNNLKDSLSQVVNQYATQTKVNGDKVRDEVIQQGERKINRIFSTTRDKLIVAVNDHQQVNGDLNVNQEEINKKITNLESQFVPFFKESITSRSIDVEYENMLFRIFIWRDMIEEMIQENAWFGINFGKPQRSKRLEVSRMAYGEWTRDGWIAPHNSWLHYIYRGGIGGVLFIGFVFYVFIKSFRYFIAHRNVVGVLLGTIIIYWFTIANFLVIFEVPYNAIPVWTFLGMVLAYKKSLSNVKITKE